MIGECMSLKTSVYSSNLCSMGDIAAMVVDDVISIANDELLTARREKYKYERYRYICI